MSKTKINSFEQSVPGTGAGLPWFSSQAVPLYRVLAASDLLPVTFPNPRAIPVNEEIRVVAHAILIRRVRGSVKDSQLRNNRPHRHHQAFFAQCVPHHLDR